MSRCHPNGEPRLLADLQQTPVCRAKLKINTGTAFTIPANRKAGSVKYRPVRPRGSEAVAGADVGVRSGLIAGWRFASIVAGGPSGRPDRTIVTGGTDMTTPSPVRHTIEVDADIHDVLARTAETRGTDIGGALRYLLEVPIVPASPVIDEDAENLDDEDLQ
jgi:hypothetical protein